MAHIGIVRFQASLFVCCLALLVSACQTISTTPCGDQNWTALGLEHGKAGLNPEEPLSNLAIGCGAAVTESDQLNYIDGYESGLARFCTFKNGEEQAIAGLENQLRCSDVEASHFNDGYRIGLMQFCTSSGAQRHAQHIMTYQGTCPTTIEQTFLYHYISALENKIPDLYYEIVELESELMQASLSIDHLKNRQLSYDFTLDVAIGNLNEDRAEYLRGRRTDITLELFKAENQKYRTQEELTLLLEQRDRINQLLELWRPHLREVA